MATIYNFNVQVVSPFCAYDSEYVRDVIEKLLKDWEDVGDHKGNRLESITVEDTSAYRVKNPQFESSTKDFKTYPKKREHLLALFFKK